MTATEHAITSGPAAAGVPLYVRVAISLRTRIHRGEWGVGQQLPSFDELLLSYNFTGIETFRTLQLICLKLIVRLKAFQPGLCWGQIFRTRHRLHAHQLRTSLLQ
jgi:hypothetical protein